MNPSYAALSQTKVSKRLRVFAGPNGSGKTTIINSIRKFRANGKPIDFGVYINADDIASSLSSDKFSFRDYRLTRLTREEFIEVVLNSGLVGKGFSDEAFKRSFSMSKAGQISLRTKKYRDNLAQIIADFLRKKLLEEERKISFETVFSHPSKVEFMREALRRGYKNYFYFVSTKSPRINIYRIKNVRVKSGGHDVPEGKIEARYYRSLELLYDAAETAYQAFFFDNSESDGKFEPFAHFKVVGGEKQWDSFEGKEIPFWFDKYYLQKM